MMKRIGVYAVASLLVFPTLTAHAEISYLSAPLAARPGKVSMATTAREYRLDVARHIYESYPDRIYKGRLPPLIHAVVVLETTVDEHGRPRDVKVVRGPSHAPDVTAAVREMTYRVGPLPVPAKLRGPVHFIEIWLVHKNGRFQLDALTEGQD
jgi:periplasmic protein TonB